jgi:SAM-dependent methyltransferase
MLLKMAARSLVSNTALGFGPIRRARQRRQLRVGYDASKDAVDYVRGVFEAQRKAIGDVSGKDVIEIGPGGNVGVALSFLSAGAKSATCIDVVPWAQDTALNALYAEISSIPAERVRYLSPVDITATPLADACADIIYSNACFEHFADPRSAIREIARLLRPGGVTSHQIDLRDHRDFKYPLEFLRYGERTWKLMSSNRGDQLTNRWRLSDYLECFAGAGLQVRFCDVNQTTAVNEKMRASLAPRFRAKALEDLSVLSVLLVAAMARVD